MDMGVVALILSNEPCQLGESPYSHSRRVAPARRQAPRLSNASSAPARKSPPNSASSSSRPWCFVARDCRGRLDYRLVYRRVAVSVVVTPVIVGMAMRFLRYVRRLPLAPFLLDFTEDCLSVE
jgi:hypothetical protein